MIGFSRKNNITLFETMTRVFEVIDIKERIQKNVKNFKLLLDKYISLKDKISLEELIRALIDELGIIRLFKEEHSLESITKLENIEFLLEQISEYNKKHPNASIENFLMEVALTSDLEFIDESKNEVKIMTIPNAKGLEYQVVFVAGLEEEMFPLSNKFLPEADLEEERRMFYLAITRASEKLYLSHARSRYRFGEVAYQGRSRFIDEINQDLIEEVDVGANRKANRKTKKELYLEFFENLDYEDITKTNNKLKVGNRVMHEKFGLGKVVQIVGSGENSKASVVFEGNNVKQLMLKFAKLKVLT
jgi:DNA helicase-2/ATP-dependent DNA helicase PcrA